jgi:hypothetical protein
VTDLETRWRQPIVRRDARQRLAGGETAVDFGALKMLHAPLMPPGPAFGPPPQPPPVPAPNPFRDRRLKEALQ